MPHTFEEVEEMQEHMRKSKEQRDKATEIRIPFKVGSHDVLSMEERALLTITSINKTLVGVYVDSQNMELVLVVPSDMNIRQVVKWLGGKL